jgi:multidrug resistance efflux pump
MAAGSVLGAAGAYSSSKARKQAYNTQGQIDLNNAQINEWQAQQAEAAGADQERTSRLHTQQVVGAGRAQMAANGVDLGTGSAAEVTASTKVVGEHDALAIRDNASRAAWASRMQAQAARDAAAVSFDTADAINPMMSAATSLLASAPSVSKSWTDGVKRNAWYTQPSSSWMGATFNG